VRALKGCKTDRIDCQRIAEFLQYGLLRSSFVPPRPIRELRELTRGRAHLQGDRNRVINRIGRLLETVNVKLGSVISNIVGASGMAILQALARGIGDPEKLAGYKVAKLKCTHEQLVSALDGRFDDHFRWCLRDLLDRLAYLDRKLADLEARTREAIDPHMPVVRRLCTIPGVDYKTACAIVAEIGVDMSKFPSANHLASWAGLCPGNNQSGGKRFSGRTRKGDRYLRRLLIQNAWSVAHMKDCGLAAVFFKFAANKGGKKAAMAVAHKILVIAYYVIRDGVAYKDPGGDYLDQRDPERTAKRLLARLERIGFPIDPNLRARMGTRRKGKPARAPIPLDQAGGCPQCAKWGIRCIHARKQKPASESGLSDSQHSG
jgi:transposase